MTGNIISIRRLHALILSKFTPKSQQFVEKVYSGLVRPQAGEGGAIGLQDVAALTCEANGDPPSALRIGHI
jgi:hypothetical protein